MVLGWWDHRLGNVRCTRGDRGEAGSVFGDTGPYCQATKPRFQPKDNGQP